MKTRDFMGFDHQDWVISWNLIISPEKNRGFDTDLMAFHGIAPGISWFIANQLEQLGSTHRIDDGINKSC